LATDKRRRTPETCSIGVDIGGTFTDIVAVCGQRSRIHTAKVLTDYEDLARGVIKGVQSVLRGNALDPGQVTRVVHGTTLVTNSLIERRGVKTALVVTEGFRDLLELGRESRYDIYDIDIELPSPLVPPELVFEVRERVTFRGERIVPLDEESVAGVIDRLQAAGVQSVAICLLHAYAAADHERRVAALISARLPGVGISLSSEIMPDLREYERASTTTANAYVQPLVKGYLERLGTALQALGIRGPLSIITSDGSVVDVDTATRFPVRLTESGPAGGATAAAHLGLAAGKPDLIAYDMGGTTAKICVIDGGRPLKSNAFEFGRVYRFAKGSGLPLQVPVIEMIEIGAGGGSIAHVNGIGMLQIGPESANASPGPACYGLGGTRPTVTDADLVLGYLDAGSFLGGTMRLDVERARDAIRREVAERLRMSVEDAAHAIHRVVNANMARAAKVHCLEHGNDPRRFCMFAYGGAGPVHAYGVARLVGMREILYPLRAGVLSALGFLVSRPSFEVLRGRIAPLFGCDPRTTHAMVEDMVREATEIVRQSLPGAARLEVAREVAVRYEGQSYEIYVPFPGGPLDQAKLRGIAKRFADAYARRYHALPEHDRFETVRWRVRVTAPAQRTALDRMSPPGGQGAPKPKAKRPIYVAERGRFVTCPVYDRPALPVGHTLCGPAVVEEAESTVYLGPHARATVTRQGDLSVAIAPAAASRTVRRTRETSDA